jgi:uncharacterized protein YjbI with pentapeptide repeats
VAEITRVDLIKMIAAIPAAFLLEGFNYVVRLSGVDLSGLDMSFLDLSGAELVGANLRNSRLIGTKLYSANVSEADFTDADCRGFSLDHGNAINTRFVRAKMGPLDLAKYPLVIQPQSMLEKVQFESTDFTDADLRQAHFNGSSMVDCTFARAKLEQCDFRRCEIDDASAIDRRVLAIVKAAKSKRRKAVTP